MSSAITFHHELLLMLIAATGIMFRNWERPSHREYWMIYRGPGFLAVVWFGSSPNPPPLPRQQAVSLSRLPLCRRSRLLMRRRGWGRSHNIRRRDSLVLYKSFSTHCPHRCMNNLQIHAAYYHMSIIWISRALWRVLTIDMLTIWIIWWLYIRLHISLPFSGICVLYIVSRHSCELLRLIQGLLESTRKGGVLDWNYKFNKEDVDCGKISWATYIPYVSVLIILESWYWAGSIPCGHENNLGGGYQSNNIRGRTCSGRWKRLLLKGTEAWDVFLIGWRLKIWICHDEIERRKNTPRHCPFKGRQFKKHSGLRKISTKKC